jgi:hypothetical protein
MNRRSTFTALALFLVAATFTGMAFAAPPRVLETRTILSR